MSLKTLLKSPLTALIRSQPIRQRILFELKHRYYADLDLQIPLGHGLICPLSFAEAWDSFGEIFIQGEYAGALDQVGPPQCWLDLGCHAGFFSLYVLWRRARAGLSLDGKGLLVDGDSRMESAVARMIAVNGLAERLQFKRGVISQHAGAQLFHERPHMSSSLADPKNTSGPGTWVATLLPGDLLAIAPPPYDLVKLDVEGSEYDFLESYGEVLEQTRFLLLEWHATPADAGGSERIRALAGARNLIETPMPASAGKGPKPAVETGLLLFRNPRLT